jgi:hypothetical protein
MRHTPLHTKAGSPSDCVNSVTVMLRECRDLADVEAVYPRVLSYLEFTLRRVEWVARKHGSSPAVIPACRWLDSVLREHAAMDCEEGELIRSELRGLVARIRERA